VTDPGTRDDLQGTSTHPESKGQLQVLSSPNVQPWIVLAQFVKILPEKNRIGPIKIQLINI
jgi:hypothetical protein